MTEVERVAREIREIVQRELLRVRAVQWKTGTLRTSADVVARALAPIVLREKRRARGRTLGWIRVADTRHKFDGSVRGFVCGKHGMVMSEKMARKETGGSVARVVAVAKGAR